MTLATTAAGNPGRLVCVLRAANHAVARHDDPGGFYQDKAAIGEGPGPGSRSMGRSSGERSRWRDAPPATRDSLPRLLNLGHKPVALGSREPVGVCRKDLLMR